MRMPSLLVISALGGLACAPAERPPEATGPISVADAGFATPEGMLHDPTADVYLVSNINGGPTDRDDNGFISQVAPDGRVRALKWIDGATDAVRLDAPKGLALRGDTLFVADIDTVRLFHRTSGAVLGAWGVPGATFLNDLAVGPDGTVYATDSGLRITADGPQDTGTDAVYRFDGARPTAIVSGAGLGRPNGIVADATGLTVVTFGSGTVYRVELATGARTPLPTPPEGGLDGVVALPGGEFLVSSWGGARVYRLGGAGAPVAVTDSVPSPADIAYDARRNRLLIPVFTENRLLFLPLGTR